MPLPVDLRLGTPADIQTIAEMMLLAGGGQFEQLLDDIVPGIGAEPLLGLALAINQAGSAFGCDNAIFADRDGLVAGMLLCFAASDYRLPDAVTAFVPPGRLHRIETLIGSCVPDSYYVHSLAVLPAARRSGVASCLMQAAAELAHAQGFGALSLHVWHGNAPALALYRRLGFATHHEIDLPPSSRLHWDGPVAVMVADAVTLMERTRRHVA